MKIYLSSNLKYLREKKQLNQSQVGSQVGKGHTTIGNWEKAQNEPNFSEITALANFFEISEVDLLFTDLSQSVAKTSKKYDSPLKSHQLKDKSVEYKKASNAIIYVPQDQEAHYAQQYHSHSFLNNLPVFSLPGLPDGEYRMFDAPPGAKLLQEGDKVICRKATLNEVKEQAYLMVAITSNGVVISTDVISKAVEYWKAIWKISNIQASASAMQNRIYDLEEAIGAIRKEVDEIRRAKN